MNEFTAWVTIATGVCLLILGGLGTVFFFFYRRDILRNDKAHADTYQVLEAYGLKIDSAHRQIRDTRAAVACCETELKIEHYPYTD